MIQSFIKINEDVDGDVDGDGDFVGDDDVEVASLTALIELIEWNHVRPSQAIPQFGLELGNKLNENEIAPTFLRMNS